VRELARLETENKHMKARRADAKAEASEHLRRLAAQVEKARLTSDRAAAGSYYTFKTWLKLLGRRRNRMDPTLPSEIVSITAQLIEKYKPEKIILFGSAARGDSNPDSDADFLIPIKKPKRLSDPKWFS